MTKYANPLKKIIGGWIQWPNMQLLFKFQVNRMKIDNFRRPAYFDLLAYVDFQKNWWLNWVSWDENPLQISSQSDENWGFWKSHLSCWPLDYVDLLTSKTTGFFLMTNSTMWWSFVKIGLKLWPVNDKQTDRQNNKIDWPIYLKKSSFLQVTNTQTHKRKRSTYLSK